MIDIMQQLEAMAVINGHTLRDDTGTTKFFQFGLEKNCTQCTAEIAINFEHGGGSMHYLYAATAPCGLPRDRWSKEITDAEWELCRWLNDQLQLLEASFQ